MHFVLTSRNKTFPASLLWFFHRSRLHFPPGTFEHFCFQRLAVDSLFTRWCLILSWAQTFYISSLIPWSQASLLPLLCDSPPLLGATFSLELPYIPFAEAVSVKFTRTHIHLQPMTPCALLAPSKDRKSIDSSELRGLLERVLRQGKRRAAFDVFVGPVI